MFAVDPDQAIDELEAAILDLSRQLDATMGRYLSLVRTFDQRRGWIAYSFTDCAHWLAHRCALSLATAQDHVRVARALKDLPVVSRGLADGTLSYSKVRALVRYATVDNVGDLVAFATRVTAWTLEERIRELKNGEVASVASASRRHHRQLHEGDYSIRKDDHRANCIF